MYVRKKLSNDCTKVDNPFLSCQNNVLRKDKKYDIFTEKEYGGMKLTGSVISAQKFAFLNIRYQEYWCSKIIFIIFYSFDINLTRRK